MLNSFSCDDLCVLDIELKDKKELFEKIVEVAENLDIINAEDKNTIVEAFIKKEKNTVTYLGNEYSIPHVRSEKIKKHCVIYIRTVNGIKWSDDDKVKNIFVILSKNTDRDLHIDTLMNISKKVLSKKSSDIFKNSKNTEEILSIIKS